MLSLLDFLTYVSFSLPLEVSVPSNQPWVPGTDVRCVVVVGGPKPAEWRRRSGSVGEDSLTGQHLRANC